jgi:hypothetical protein
VETSNNSQRGGGQNLKKSLTAVIATEAIEIEFHLNNVNRDVGFSLSKSWKPLSHLFSHEISTT